MRYVGSWAESLGRHRCRCKLERNGAVYIGIFKIRHGGRPCLASLCRIPTTTYMHDGRHQKPCQNERTDSLGGTTPFLSCSAIPASFSSTWPSILAMVYFGASNAITVNWVFRSASFGWWNSYEKSSRFQYPSRQMKHLWFGTTASIVLSTEVKFLLRFRITTATLVSLQLR